MNSAFINADIKQFLLKTLSSGQTKNVTTKIEYLEITPSKIKAGSKKYIKYRNGVTKAKSLDMEEATLAAKAMCQFFAYKINATVYSKASIKDLFYIEDNIIKMSSAKVYINTGAGSCILVASNHKSIRTALSDFSEFFTRFIKSKREIFLDYEEMDYILKRSEFSGVRGLSSKYVQHLGTIGGRSQISMGSKELKPKSITIETNIVKSGKASTSILEEYINEEVRDTSVEYTSTFKLSPFSKILGKLHIVAIMPSWLYDEKSKKPSKIEFNSLKVPIFDNLFNKFASIFHIKTGKKKKFASKVRSSTFKSSGTVKPKVNISISSAVSSSTVSSDVIVEVPEQEAFCGLSLDMLLRYKGLLNMSLHDQLYKIMGHEGYDPHGQREILNYRTGRFARSAEIKNLTIDPETCTLHADFTYMKHPYNIFEPAGALYKYGRDPNILIGTAIREIAKDIMKNRFAVITRLV